MITITKPDAAPAILVRDDAKERTAALQAQFAANEADYRAGTRRFTFQRAIYGHESVIEALVAAQHGKCCFCEARIVDEGDVEHYRPKSGVRQRANDSLARPGYYWLAYDWDNLLLTCSICNQRYKRNLFPLADPSLRATSHRDDTTHEVPLLINPAQQDPEKYIAFNGEMPFAIDGNPHGEETIKILGFKRRREVKSLTFCNSSPLHR